METEKMDVSKREVEERGMKILNEFDKISELMDKKRQSKADKIEMRRRLNDCMGSFHLLIFDLATE